MDHVELTEQHHDVAVGDVGDLFVEGTGRVGDGDALGGSVSPVDAVHTDAPFRDRLELEPVDHVGGEFVVTGDDPDTPIEGSDECITLEVLTRDLGHDDLEAGGFHGRTPVLDVADELDAGDADLHRSPSRCMR